MLASWDVDFNRVSEVIDKDPVLATRVLSVANSGAFGRGRSIVEVRQAVTRLGIMPLRAYAIGWTVLSVFHRMKVPEYWNHKTFVAHSVAMASLTEQLTDAMEHEQKAEAYISGLLHDMGKLILAVNLPDEYFQAITTARLTERPARELEWEVIGIDHAELSGIAAHQWNLPESVCTAIRYHHNPSLDHSSAVPLSLVISRADTFLNASQPPIEETDDTPTEIIHFPGHQLEAATALINFWSSWPMMRSLFA